MTAAERLGRAAELLSQAVQEIEDAEPDTPAYSIPALAFLKAELRVARRRVENCAKVLGSTTRRPG